MSTDTIESAPAAIEPSAAPVVSVAAPTQAAVAATASDYRQYIDDKGNFTNPDWAGEEKSLAEKITSIPSLIKCYRTLERMNSNGNKIAIPGEHATPEEREAFHAKLRGVDSPDGYEMNAPENLGLKPDEASLKEFKEIAFKNGVSKSAMAALTEAYFRQTASGIKMATDAKASSFEASVSSLKKEWGADYDANVKLAEQGASIAGLSGDVLKATPELSNNPHFIKAMAKIAGMTKEVPSAGVRSGQQGFGEDLAGQISAIKNDRAGPFWNKHHPDHAKTMDRVQALYEKLHPETS